MKKPAGYTETAKTRDGQPIYKRDDETSKYQKAYIVVKGYPRLARFAGMVTTVSMAERCNYSELID